MTPEEEAAFRKQLDMSSADGYVPGPSAPAPVVAGPPSRFAEALNRVGTYGGPIGRAALQVGDPTGIRSSLLSVYDNAGKLVSGPVPKGPDSPKAPALAPYAMIPEPSGPEPVLPDTPPLSPAGARMSAAGAAMGGGPSSTMSGLKAAIGQAHANQLGSFDTEKDLVELGGELKGERIDKQAELQQLEAERRARDANILAQHEAEAAQKHEAFLARNQQLADQIGAQKIDPSSVLGDKSLGAKISMLIGGALSGAVGQGPAFMSHLDNMVSEGVRAQMANAEGVKAKLAARQSVFGQMMQESGDRRVAEAQARNLAWEAIKQDTAARASRLEIPEVQNNAKLIMNGIETDKQNPLQTQIATDAYRAQMAAAAASAAAQSHAADVAWQRGKDVAEMANKKEALQLERDKFDAENGKDAGGLGKAGRQALALEQAKTQQELDANLRAVNAADPAAITAGGSLGSTASHLPAWVPGVTGARKDVNAREEYNALVRPGVGAAWKMRTGGVEPKNPTILEEQARAFTIQPSDNEEVAKQRIALFKKHMIESAGAQGASPPALPSTLKFTGAPKK